MAKFSESLFQSIRDFGKMSPTEGRRQAMQHAPVYKQMGTTDPIARSAGRLFGNFGLDTSSLQTAPERIAAETKGLDMSKPMDAAQAMLIRAQYIQDPQVQAAMIMKAQEIMQLDQKRALEEAQAARDAALQQQVRESLIKRATELNLGGIANTLAAGGDITEAQKAIREQEIARLPKDVNVKQRLAQFQRAGGTAQKFKDLELGKATQEEFQNTMDSLKGSPKAYQDSQGNVQTLTTNDFGLVKNPLYGKGPSPLAASAKEFVYPSEIGLTLAPNVQRVINEVDLATQEFRKAEGKKAGESFAELQEQMANIEADYTNNMHAQKLLDSPEGVFAGPLAPFRKGLERLSYVMTGGNTSLAKTANTEILVINRSKSLLEKAKYLGTGSGFSDKDREFLEKMSGVDITLTEDTIRELLRVERTVFRAQAVENNRRVDVAFRLGRITEKEAKVFYKEPLPEQPARSVNTAAVGDLVSINGKLYRKMSATEISDEPEDLREKYRRPEWLDI